MAVVSAPTGLTAVQLKLLNDFSNVVKNHEFQAGKTVQRLHLLYDADTGYSIDLVESAPETNPVPVE